MVFTLTAAMLVGTPLTASARGLTDLYTIEDNKGHTIGNENVSGTGTVSNTETNTNTSALDLNEEVAGIAFDQTNVEMGVGDEETLSVRFVDDNGEVIEGQADLQSRFFLNWKSSNTAVVTLKNLDPANGNVNKMGIVAKRGGRADVTATVKLGQVTYTATAKVYVKQYATKIWFDEDLDDDVIEGYSLNLDEYRKTDPEEACDNFTYAVTSGGKYATIKGSILTVKKNSEGKQITIVAMGKDVKSDPVDYTIKGQKPAKVIKFYNVDQDLKYDSSTETTRGYTWVVNKDGDITTDKDGLLFEAALLVDKNETAPGTQSNDKVISWTSQKPDIVDIYGEPISKGKRDKKQVRLVAKSAGTTQVSIKTASGKTAKMKVTVNAFLTGITVEEAVTEPRTAYTGETVQLEAKQNFDSKEPNGKGASDDFIDAGLNWQFVEYDGVKVSDMKNSATLSKTGLLTIKPQLGRATKLAVKVSNAKNISKTGNSYYAKKDTIWGNNKNAAVIVFDLKQINITGIYIMPNLTAGTDNPLLSVVKSSDEAKAPSGKAISKLDSRPLKVDYTRFYKVVATAKILDDNDNWVDPGKDEYTLADGRPVASALSWISKKPKNAVAGKNALTGRGSIEGIKAAKKVNVEVSGSTCTGSNSRGKKYGTIKATIQLDVVQPTTTITLTTRNKGIANTGKAQTISFTAKVDKGATNDIVWTAQKNDEKPYFIQKGKLVLGGAKGKSYALGDRFTVTASSPGADNLSTSMTLTVVKPTPKVDKISAKNLDNPEDEVDFQKLKLYGRYNLSTTLKDLGIAGEDHNAKVTYTVSKPGYIFIVGDIMTPIQEGKVNITATTDDGKKATIKVNIVP